MSEEKKYSVIELSEILGVKRTTINDWLSKYAMYIETQIQGKRKIYTESALTVLQKIAELRSKNMSSFDIDTELTKQFAVHPQPEPIEKEGKTEQTIPTDEVAENLTDKKMTDETAPENVAVKPSSPTEDALIPLNQNVTEMLMRFQGVIERLEAIEASVRALPPPAPAPTAASDQTENDSADILPEGAEISGAVSPVSPLSHKNGIVWAFFILLVLVIAAGGFYAFTEIKSLKKDFAKEQDRAKSVEKQQSDEIFRQKSELTELERKRSQSEAEVSKLQNDIKLKEDSYKKELSALQKSNEVELKLHREELNGLNSRLEVQKLAIEKAESERRLAEERRQSAEKAQKAAESKAVIAEKAAAAAEKAKTEAEAKASAAEKAKTEAEKKVETLPQTGVKESEKPVQSPASVPAPAGK